MVFVPQPAIHAEMAADTATPKAVMNAILAIDIPLQVPQDAFNSAMTLSSTLHPKPVKAAIVRVQHVPLLIHMFALVV